MNLDLILVIFCVCMIGCCLWAGPFIFHKDYLAKVANSKEIGKTSGLIIPSEISAFIARFSPSVAIRVANDANAIPQAVIFNRHPAYVIVPRYILGQIGDDKEQFEIKHSLALIAHEVGHIKVASKSVWSQELCVSGGLIAFSFLAIALSKQNWIGSLLSLISLTISPFIFMAISRSDEYRADCYAIKDASIPIADFSEALLALKLRVSQTHNESVNRLKFIKRAIIGILGSTHPSIEKRINRLKTHCQK